MYKVIRDVSRTVEASGLTQSDAAQKAQELASQTGQVYLVRRIDES